LSKGVFGVVAREVNGIEFDAEMFLLGHAWEMQCMQPAITVRGPKLLMDILVMFGNAVATAFSKNLNFFFTKI